ncbi:hypothetical protein [Pseudomonas sp. NFIX28]|uniref:hypothetical protein n=1 Tax=Pseudomonas sp. NFIX28 TaxID=1566235 RepID=UPI001113855A|nr:hypothetical protein [Pseudomonas sp. NFIX28]
MAGIDRSAMGACVCTPHYAAHKNADLFPGKNDNIQRLPRCSMTANKTPQSVSTPGCPQSSSKARGVENVFSSHQSVPPEKLYKKGKNNILYNFYGVIPGRAGIMRRCGYPKAGPKIRGRAT